MPPYSFLHQVRTPIAITYITSVLYERTKGCTERTDGVGSVEREISLTGPNAFPQLLSHGETGLVGRLQAVGISTAIGIRWPKARMTVTGAMDSARPNSQIYNGGLGCLRNSCSNTIRLDRMTASKLFGLTVNFEGIGEVSIGVPVPRCGPMRSHWKAMLQTAGQRTQQTSFFLTTSSSPSRILDLPLNR